MTYQMHDDSFLIVISFLIYKVLNLVKPVVPNFQLLYAQFINEAVRDKFLKFGVKGGKTVFHQVTLAI